MSRNSTKRNEMLAECSFSLSESAFLMLRTDYASFTFASQLNALFGLQLTRQRDIVFPSTSHSLATICPLFLYYDELNMLYYILIENPREASIDRSVDFYDKILAIVGGDAALRMQQMYTDLSENAPRAIAPDDIREQRYEDRRISFIQNGVVSVEYFDFLHPNHELMQEEQHADDDYGTIVVQTQSQRHPQSQQLSLEEDFGYSLPAAVDTYRAMTGQSASGQKRVFNLFGDLVVDEPEVHRGKRAKRVKKDPTIYPTSSLPYADSNPRLQARRVKQLASIYSVSHEVLTEVEHHLSTQEEEADTHDLSLR